MRTDSLFDPIYSQLERVMDLRSEQHNMVAANLSNSSTPGYMAQELDFSTVLADVMETEGPSLNMANTDDKQMHLGGITGMHSTPAITTHEAPPWSLDGNSVDMEQQLMHMIDNNLMFNAVTRSTAKKLALLKTAITG